MPITPTLPAKRATAPANAPQSLLPPPGGAVVRMYRIGHGDCFLIAFDGADGKPPGEVKPVYVLIDCGYKPGSPEDIVPANDHRVDEVVANIKTATGGVIDVAIITHEHQDHVNGITSDRFKGFRIKQAWFAWTEDPKDALANALRKKYKDSLAALAVAQNQLAAAGNAKEAGQVRDFLEFELGYDDTRAMDEALNGIAKGSAAIGPNKRAMKLFKDLAEDGVHFLRPHEEIYTLPGAKGVRVFSLGPPRDETLLLQDEGPEEFPQKSLAMGNGANSALVAKGALFDPRFALSPAEAFAHKDYQEFFKKHYGKNSASPAGKSSEVTANAAWRRIDDIGAMSALELASKVNGITNNSSLVLAFELGQGGKVLLFTGDAQRGNWISWASKDWPDGKQAVKAKDLLGRTVFYKVGHHGSHNATLNGTSTDTYANLGWMGLGKYAEEFTAMIPAVRAWALTQKGWNHPLKAIKLALLKKCDGRVFQSDADIAKMPLTAADVPTRATDELPTNWKLFQDRMAGNALYFDLKITP